MVNSIRSIDISIDTRDIDVRIYIAFELAFHTFWAFVLTTTARTMKVLWHYDANHLTSYVTKHAR